MRAIEQNEHLIKILEDELKALGLYSHLTIMHDNGEIVSTTEYIPYKIREILDELKDAYIENYILETAE